MSRGLCAYAITRAPAPDTAEPADYRLVTHDGLALAVAEVALAHRHDDVVRALFEHGPVLPLPFDTTLRDEPSAVQLLTDHHDEAREWLDRVEGHREWGVRARLAPPTKPAEATPEGLSGAEYLAVRRDRLAAAARTRRDGLAAATTLHETLSGHAKETVRRDRRTPLLDAAYLVRTDAEPDFHAATTGHDELAVEVTGPLPPYSFVRLDLTTEAVAHA
jgi:Gas vesicle synthesis protein GvpL/GvpF